MKLLAPLFRKLGYAPIRRMPTRERRDIAAAATNRLTADWRTTPISIDSLLSGGALETVCARAEDLQESNEYFGKYLTMFKTNVLGDSGMALKNKATDGILFQGGKLTSKPDVLANAIIEESFYEWGRKEYCTVSRDTTWLGVQQLALETIGVRGETLWRKVVGAEARNRFQFALQPIACGRIDSSLNRNLENGDKIRLGVQTNPAGEVTHYWLREADPADVFISSGSWTSKPYPASDFIHPKLILRIGQTRGVPPSLRAMMRFKMLGGYEEAEIEGSRAAASKMAFITKNGTGVEYTGENAEGGGKYMDAEPGSIEELPMGMDIKPVDWNHPNSIFPDFTAACKQGIACGLSMSYPRMFGDYGSINFSAGKLAQSDDDRVWCYLQTFFAAAFLDEVFSAWLQAALLAGAVKVDLANGKTIRLPAAKYEKFNQPSWRAPDSAWFDPKKEAEANELELANGLTSPTRVLSGRELDADEIIEETKEYLEKVKQAGLPMPRWALPPKGAVDPNAEEADEAAPRKPAKPEKTEAS